MILICLVVLVNYQSQNLISIHLIVSKFQCILNDVSSLLRCAREMVTMEVASDDENRPAAHENYPKNFKSRQRYGCSKYVWVEIVLRHFSHLSTTITLACHIFLWRLKRQCHKRNQFSATTEIESKRENVIKEDVFNNQPRKMV